MERTRYLDGLRGVAIFIVLWFHYLGPTYASHLPYGKSLSWLPLASTGWVGVYLFFMISGYVIFMTLEKCASFGEFMRRRWLRLFPAMLLASIATYLASQVIGDLMPSGQANPIDLLPGLTFVSESFWHAGLRQDVKSLDGVFWTLYVEVGFYLVIGALYFTLGWKRSLIGLIAIWVAVMVAPSAIAHLPKTPLSRLIEPCQWLGMNHYGWFAAGAIFYKARTLGSDRLFWLATLLGISAALTYTNTLPTDAVSRAFLIACAVLFSAAQRWKALQSALEAPAFQFVGFISYPLYLIHNEIGIGLMGLVAPAIPASAMIVLPVAVTALMFFLAWVVAKHVEPNTRLAIRQGLGTLIPQAA
jgi:peptidoglycan/LPS O-acetylase OafA/YrhL